MKKLIICLVSLWTTSQTNAQMRDTTLNMNTHKIDANSFLQKSKNKQKVAWIMAGGGATLLLTGIIIPRREIIYNDIIFGQPVSFTGYKNDGIKALFALTGTLSILGSIPFFISSHHNKKKSASLSFKNEPVQQINKSSMVYRNIPSLGIKINL